MEITIIIGLVLFLVCIFLAFKLIKNVFAAIGTVVLLMIVFTAGCGFFLYNDAISLRDEFPNSVNQILFTSDTGVSAGIALLPIKGSQISLETIQPIEDSKILTLSEKYKNANYKEMLTDVQVSDYYPEEIISQNNYNEDTFKIIFIDLDIIRNSPLETIDIAKELSSFDETLSQIPLEVSREELVSIIESDDEWIAIQEILSEKITIEDIASMMSSMGIQLPSGELIDEEILALAESEGLDIDELSQELDLSNFKLTEEEKDIFLTEMVMELKSAMVNNIGTDNIKPFLIMLTLQKISTEEDGLKYLFTSYKSKEIEVYPSSIILDLIRLSPTSLIDKVKEESTKLANEAKSSEGVTIQ